MSQAKIQFSRTLMRDLAGSAPIVSLVDSLTKQAADAASEASGGAVFWYKASYAKDGRYSGVVGAYRPWARRTNAKHDTLNKVLHSL